MNSLSWWVAPVPQEGVVGTASGDLGLGSSSLHAPGGFDLPGGSASVLQRSYEAYLQAQQDSTGALERQANLLGAARAMNNLGVWFLIKWDDPDSTNRAFTAFREAERIAVTGVKPVHAPADVSGIYFNLCQLLWHAGRQELSRKYFDRAAASGWTSDEPWSDTVADRFD